MDFQMTYAHCELAVHPSEGSIKKSSMTVATVASRVLDCTLMFISLCVWSQSR